MRQETAQDKKSKRQNQKMQDRKALVIFIEKCYQII